MRGGIRYRESIRIAVHVSIVLYLWSPTLLWSPTPKCYGLLLSLNREFLHARLHGHHILYTLATVHVGAR